MFAEKNELTGQVDYNLDYNYVCNVVKSVEKMPRIPSEVDRQKFIFEYDRFQDAVVMPWYRDIERPVFYYVAEVLLLFLCLFLFAWLPYRCCFVQIVSDATPSSKFPDEKFSDFNEYFEQKYNITIYNQNQPLLDVDYTSGWGFSILFFFFKMG